MDVAYNWGSTADERARRYPCDELIGDPDHILFRAVSIDAPAGRVFRWLCQLRAAPYSYDWIDNGGRRSPRQLIPGLEQLHAGQRVMTIFTLLSFEADRHFTIGMSAQSAVRMFGELVVTYWLEPVSAGSTRLVVKMGHRKKAAGWLFHALAWGDLIMMRKQLLTLKALAERG